MSPQAGLPAPVKVPSRTFHELRVSSSLPVPITTRRVRDTSPSVDHFASRDERTCPDDLNALNPLESASESFDHPSVPDEIVPEHLLGTHSSSSGQYLPSILRGSAAHSNNTKPGDRRRRNLRVSWGPNQITTFAELSVIMQKPRSNRATQLRMQINKQTAESSSTSNSMKPAEASSSPYTRKHSSRSGTYITSSDTLKSPESIVPGNTDMGPRKSTSPEPTTGSAPHIPHPEKQTQKPTKSVDTKNVNLRQRLSDKLAYEPKSSPSSRLPRPSMGSASTPKNAIGLGLSSNRVSTTRPSKLSTRSSAISAEPLPMIEKPSVFESVTKWNSQVDDSSYFDEGANANTNITSVTSVEGNSSDISQIGSPTTGHARTVDYQIGTDVENNTGTSSSKGKARDINAQIESPIRDRSSTMNNQVDISIRCSASSIISQIHNTSEGEVSEINQITTPTRANANEISHFDASSAHDHDSSQTSTPSGSFLTPIQSSYGYELRERRSARELILGPDFSNSASAATSSEEVEKSRAKGKGTANISVPRAYPARDSSLPSFNFMADSGATPVQTRAQSAAAVGPTPTTKPRAKRESTLFKPTAASSARKSASVAQQSVNSIAAAGSSAAMGSGRLTNFVRKSRDSLNKITKRRSTNLSARPIGISRNLNTPSMETVQEHSGQRGQLQKTPRAADHSSSASNGGEAPAAYDGASTSTPLEAAGAVGNVAEAMMAGPVVEGDEELLVSNAQQMSLLPSMLIDFPGGQIRDQLTRLISAAVLASMQAREDLARASARQLAASRRFRDHANTLNEVYGVVREAVERIQRRE